MWFATFICHNLLRRFARSLLTIGGVAVAIGTTVALLGISHGFEQSTADSFGARGVEIVVVQAGVLDQLNSELDMSVGERIRQVPGVKDAAPGLVELIDYPQNKNVISVLLQGWEPDTVLFEGLEFVAGRPYEAGESHVAVLGKTLADTLGLQVGEKITLQGEAFDIVGIYRSFSVFENGGVTIPLAEAQRLMAREGAVTGYSVITDLTQREDHSVDRLCDDINALKNADGQPLGISALPTREYVSSAMHIRMIHSMAWMTSVIAISVGTIGVLNTMLMSVVERIREISILRAIGWRKLRVVQMIVSECLILSLSGAVLGTIGAILATRWLATLPAVSGFIEGRIAPVVMLQGLGMATLVGLVGALYPSIRAARLLPTEGLAHD
ncbi:MAG: ABC transporter permease [Pirellulales bacterium]|nr:ABC transporter permease [Pirellulales bacterium]